MKFLKRALIIVAALGVILVPSIAWAQVTNTVDSNKANKWTFGSAGNGNWGTTDTADQTGTRNLPDKSNGIQTLHRGQKAYFEINWSGTGSENTWRTNQSGMPVACSLAATGTSTCTSAPIHIGGTSATICINSNLGLEAVQDVKGEVRFCVDNDCTREKSIIIGDLMDPTETRLTCGVTRQDAYGDAVILGGQTIFVRLITASDPGGAGETATVWITGR